MYKLFTLEEANRLVPVVDRSLGEMQDAVRDMTALQRRVASMDEAARSGMEARDAAQEIAFLLGALHDAKAELDRLGVHLKDVESGTVDFPSRLGAEVVCLVWERGQDAITRYHRLAGDTSTRPLPGLENEAAPSIGPAGRDGALGA